MEYEVQIQSDNVKVRYSGSDYLTVVRKIGWPDTLSSKFYQDGILILETKSSYGLISEKHKIILQALKEPVRFHKNKRSYDLVVNLNVVSLKFNVFRKPLVILYKNKIRTGEVISNSPLFGPGNFIVRFDLDDEINFYALIYFIVRLQPDNSGIIL
jgi:hypothetical protein